MKDDGNPMDLVHPGILAMQQAPRCGAHSRRSGLPCKCPAMANGRCRMHGGLSSGRPTTHGRYTRESIRKRTEFRKIFAELKAILESA